MHFSQIQYLYSQAIPSIPPRLTASVAVQFRPQGLALKRHTEHLMSFLRQGPVRNRRQRQCGMIVTKSYALFDLLAADPLMALSETFPKSIFETFFEPSLYALRSAALMPSFLFTPLSVL